MGNATRTQGTVISMNCPKFICALCGRDFNEKSEGILHVLAIHNTLVYQEIENQNAVSYAEYLRNSSTDTAHEDITGEENVTENGTES